MFRDVLGWQFRSVSLEDLWWEAWHDIVIEELPPQVGPERHALDALVSQLRRWYPEAIWVPPGRWKQWGTRERLDEIMVRWEWEARPRTPHEKDALLLAIWYIQQLK